MNNKDEMTQSIIHLPIPEATDSLFSIWVNKIGHS